MRLGEGNLKNTFIEKNKMEKIQLLLEANRRFLIFLLCLSAIKSNAQFSVRYDESKSELYLIEQHENIVTYLDTVIFLNMNSEHSFQMDGRQLFVSYASVTELAYK